MDSDSRRNGLIYWLVSMSVTEMVVIASWWEVDLKRRWDTQASLSAVLARAHFGGYCKRQ